MHPLRSLLLGVVDHAGLFPPAALAMAPAVRRHAAYRGGAAAWMLGRFVVPAARLDELAEAVAALPAADAAAGGTWRLSALAAGAAELARIDAFNARHAVRDATGSATRDAASGDGVALVVDMVELKAADAAGVREIARAVAAHAGAPWAAEAYVEVPLDADPAPLAAAARDGGVRLKARTGGVTAEAFPAPAALLRFLAACAARDVPAKATAGLHHALRGEHPLTYEPGCARGTMFGFLNVLLAAAFLRAGADPAALLALLEERDPASLAADDAGVSWRGPAGVLRADGAALAAPRARGVASFGSCSFEEPVTELRALGLLPPG